MKTLFRIPAFAMALLLSILFTAPGCTASPAMTVEDVSALVSLEHDYEQAREVLVKRIDAMPIELGLAMLDIESRADVLVNRFRAALHEPITTADLNLLMQESTALYVEAYALIEPQLADMTPHEQLQVRQLNESLKQINAAYVRWLSDPQAQDRQAMFAAGLKLATAFVSLL